MADPAPPYRPSRAEIAAAHGRTVPDVIAPHLRLLFCGINPGLYSGATGYHFARPGNRFWRVLEGAGITPRLFAPYEQGQLLPLRVGIINLVERATAMADELTAEELRAGAVALAAKVIEFGPAVLAVLGMQAYRTAFSRKATMGLQQQRLGKTAVWLLPNPSGAQARYQLPEMVELFGEAWDFSSRASD